MIEVNRKLRWCPVKRDYFTGEDCPYLKGKKCKDVDIFDCFKELEKGGGS